MCFSAGTSFGSVILLSSVGLASLKKTENRSQTFFAAIPLIFAVQQLSEGFLWISLTNGGLKNVETLTTFTFLFFAQIVWPSWVPFAILKLEPNEKRKKLLKVLFGIGLIVSSYLAY